MSLNNDKTKGVLAINAGSSSLKFALYLGNDDAPSMSGLCDSIGSKHSLVKMKDAQGESLSLPDDCDLQNHEGAMKVVLGALNKHFPEVEVVAVGHRVVHGGRMFNAPVEVTDEVQAQLESIIRLAPLHQPHNLSGIYAAKEFFPGVPQVACFDTAFHSTQPFENKAFAIPYRYYDEGIIRYGFHGLSYDYINGEIAELDPAAHAGKVVVAHLGNGASLCAIEGGQSKATTMGFSALDGVPMGTRTGQIDPGVILHLLEGEGMSVAELTQLLYKESGLLGLSGGFSNDMRVLSEAGTEEGERTINYFVNKVAVHIASMAATMQGLDMIVFTAGIGENSVMIRERVCERLAWLGVEVDAARNEGSGQRVISSDNSKIKVMVIPTDEELVITRAARQYAK